MTETGNLEQLLKDMQEKWETLKTDYVYQNPIQACFFMGEYQLGMKIYEALPRRNAQDERWVGHCYRHAGHRERAREHAMRARAMGLEVAAIDLAYVGIFLGMHEESLRDLQKFNTEHLSKVDRVFYYMALGYYFIANYQQSEGYEYSQMAWKLVQATEEFVFLAPEVLSQLAWSSSNLRKKEECLYYLRRAAEICQTRFVWVIKNNMAMVFMELGKFDDAKNLFVEVIENPLRPLNIVLGRIFLAKLNMITGDTQESLLHLEEACRLAKENKLTVAESTGLSIMACIYATLDNTTKALLSINRASRISNRSAKLEFMLRKLYVEYKLGRRFVFDIITETKQILDKREIEGDIVQITRTKMFMCEYMISSGQPFKDYTDELINHFVKNDNLFDAYEDWVFLPQTFKIFKSHFPEIPNLGGGVKLHIYLFTVAREEINIQNQILNVPLKKTIELLTYLLYRERATLNEILTDVFGDQEVKKAKNYFHQIRFQLSQRCQELKIEYDAVSRRYSLKSTLPIWWDAAEHLKSGKKIDGIFLPSSGSDWVLELNHKLSD